MQTIGKDTLEAGRGPTEREPIIGAQHLHGQITESRPPFALPRGLKGLTNS